MPAPKNILAGSATIAVALASMLAATVISVSPAAAASPASGMYTTLAAGQRSPYLLIQVGRRHRIMMITLSRMRCMSGRLDMAIGLRQRDGSFSVTRRSGMFHVKTGKMLLGRDERVRGQFNSSVTATGSARVIKIPRIGARPCDSGWVRFRVAVMNPVEIWTSPFPANLTLPATATEQFAIVNRSTAASTVNRIGLTLRTRTFGTVALAAPPTPTVSTARGRCSTTPWKGSGGLASTISCDLGRLQPRQRATVTMRASFPSVPNPCTGGIELSIVAKFQRATLNEPNTMPIEDKESTFELACPN